MTWSEILFRVLLPVALGFVMGTFLGVYLGVSMCKDDTKTQENPQKEEPEE